MSHPTNSLKIVSMNVRGFKSPRRRRILFNRFRREKFDIICLQETHLSKKDIFFIEKQWSSGFHMVEGTSNSKGLLTLFSDNIDLSSSSSIIANDRVLISHVSLGDTKISIVNNYAPCVPSEKPAFLKSTTDIISI